MKCMVSDVQCSSVVDIYYIASHLVKSKLNKRQKEKRKKKKSMNTQSTDENIFQHESFCLASGYRPYLHSKDSDQCFYHLFAYLNVDQHYCTSKPKVSQSL